MKSHKKIRQVCEDFDSKYLKFVPARKHNPKTWIIDIYNADEDVWLGDVRYYGAWRQYIFRPDEGTVYEKTCMKDITEFLNLINGLQRSGVKP